METDRNIAAGRVRRGRPGPPRIERGAVLLEVILALSLLVASSAVTVGSLGNCMRRLAYVRLEARGTDLAVSTMSRIQLGLLAAEDEGPTPYEPPLAGWTWQVVIEPLAAEQGSPPLQKVQVIVRYSPQSGTERYTYRLYGLMAGKVARELLAWTPGPEDRGTQQ